jgi:hypothetical protein
MHWPIIANGLADINLILNEGMGPCANIQEGQQFTLHSGWAKQRNVAVHTYYKP